MKLIATVKTKKGFYNEIIIRGNFLKECLDKIIPEMEKSPEEIDGTKQIDWTHMLIEIHR